MKLCCDGIDCGAVAELDEKTGRMDPAWGMVDCRFMWWSGTNVARRGGSTVLLRFCGRCLELLEAANETRGGQVAGHGARLSVAVQRKMGLE